jgi:putative flavoprotein involved in K+ transport
MPKNSKFLDVVIVGAGAAGVGMCKVLQDLGIDRYVCLERETTGASFEKWTRGMRFITPSFTSNAFGSPDLNAVTYNTSPAYTLKTEHPTGAEYARYLKGVVKAFDLHVLEETAVDSIKRVSAGFVLQTSRGEMAAKFLIWAAGEFGYPNDNSIIGAEHAVHNSQIRDWRDLEGDEFTILGGYESGIDAAFHLTRLGKKVRVLDAKATWEERDSDPSIALSPYTLERLRRAQKTGNLDLKGSVIFARIERENGHYVVRGEHSEGEEFAIESPTRPILATGFAGSLSQIEGLFERHETKDYAILTDRDESTVTPNLFLIGSQVRHGDTIFCFVYKFRQRFAVVAETIGERLKIDTSPLEEYRKRGMFLDDLSCCREQCATC